VVVSNSDEGQQSTIMEEGKKGSNKKGGERGEVSECSQSEVKTFINLVAA
jgi:hypothetical protein